MSAVVPHLLTGALFGYLAVLHVRRDVSLTRLRTGVVILWSAILAVLPDVENLFGMHRDLFTNVWVLVLFPPLVAAGLWVHRWAESVTFRTWLLAAPFSVASHLWHDTFGFSNRYAELLWPFSRQVFVGQTVRVRGLDDGSVLFLALSWLVCVQWWWMRELRGVDDPRRAYGVGLLAVVALAVPLVFVLAVGWLR